MKEKLFVGGYYDDRIFKGDYFDGKTPFSKDIDTYTLEEVLELGFVEPVKEYFEETYEKEWIEATEEEKIEGILSYTQDDEIASLLYFKTEEAAENYKNQVIQEIEELEQKIEYIGIEQDSYGNFREVYILKDED